MLASYHQPPGDQLRGGHIEPVQGLLGPGPFSKIVKTLLQGHPWFVPEPRPDSRYVGVTVSNITFPEGSQDLRYHVIFGGQSPGQTSRKLPHGGPHSRPHVEGLKIGVASLHGQQVRLNDVVDVNKVAPLFSVLEEAGWFPVEQAAGDDRRHAGVRVGEGLTGTVDIEVA